MGILYGIFTLYLGFDFGLDEYKIMGLAPYGDPKRYFEAIFDLIKLKSDGTYTIPVFAENKSWEDTETHRGVLAKLTERFGPPRNPEDELTQQHMDIAAGLQAAFHSSQLHLLTHLRQRTGLSNLCMAGGTALNCTMNGVIQKSPLFKRTFIQPAAGDDGTALGRGIIYSTNDCTSTVRAKNDYAVLGAGSFRNTCMKPFLMKSAKQIPALIDTFRQ